MLFNSVTRKRLDAAVWSFKGGLMRQITAILSAFWLLGCSSAPEFRSVTPLTQNDAAVIANLAAELEREHLDATFDGMVLVATSQQTLFKAAYGFADRQQAQKNDEIGRA